jgi:AraC-like DNA-binding protein
LQLAARMLQTTGEAVIQVASEVGYDSEAAFNRAFKREFAVPPGQFRRQFKGQLGRLHARSGVVAGEGPARIPIKKSGVRL